MEQDTALQPLLLHKKGQAGQPFSIFNSTTSAAGGGGGHQQIHLPQQLVKPVAGGSGGGGRGFSSNRGNTPPVSPPQGNPGGNGPAGGAGGGGAAAAGSPAGPAQLQEVLVEVTICSFFRVLLAVMEQQVQFQVLDILVGGGGGGGDQCGGIQEQVEQVVSNQWVDPAPGPGYLNNKHRWWWRWWRSSFSVCMGGTGGSV